MPPRWECGVWLGPIQMSDEHIVGRRSGCAVVRAIRRLVQLPLGMQGTPGSLKRLLPPAAGTANARTPKWPACVAESAYLAVGTPKQIERVRNLSPSLHCWNPNVRGRALGILSQVLNYDFGDTEHFLDRLASWASLVHEWEVQSKELLSNSPVKPAAEAASWKLIVSKGQRINEQGALLPSYD
eukprot:3734304-Amphidinium_carterae.2